MFLAPAALLSIEKPDASAMRAVISTALNGSTRCIMGGFKSCAAPVVAYRMYGAALLGADVPSQYAVSRGTLLTNANATGFPNGTTLPLKSERS